jgi:hypothetical protein
MQDTYLFSANEYINSRKQKQSYPLSKETLLSLPIVAKI